MTNQQVRQWYKEQVRRIPALNEAWIREGITAEMRARRAWQIRHDARVEARSFMEDPTEVELVQRRDIELYGNPNGPTFDFLVAKARNLGSTGDRIYRAIIEDSYVTNPEVDKQFER